MKTTTMMLVALLRERGGPLLILDEADHATREALQLMRQLHDLSGCGLAFLCTPALFSALRARPNDRDAQLTSRVSYNPVVPGLTLPDIKAFCSHFGLSAAAEREATRGCGGDTQRGGNPRSLVNALICAAEIAKATNTAIEPSYITAAYAAQTRAAVA